MLDLIIKIVGKLDTFLYTVYPLKELREKMGLIKEQKEAIKEKTNYIENIELLQRAEKTLDEGLKRSLRGKGDRLVVSVFMNNNKLVNLRRRYGNTTRVIDASIQLLFFLGYFERKWLEGVGIPSHSRAITYTWDRLCDRLVREHISYISHFEIKGSRITIKNKTEC